MADEKIITSSVFEQGITEIMQDIANNLYEFEEYTEEEVANLIDLSEEEVAELTRVINDTTVALNKVYSNKKVEDLLSELEVTCNKYADEKIGGLSNIHLAYVDSLPSLGEDNTIYILKSTTGNDTLNLYDGTSWISIGEFAISLDNYYDKAEVDALLNDKANANEVVSQDDVVSDMSAVSSSTVLSTAGLEVELNKKVNLDDMTTELDKKVDKDSIATVLDDTVTDEQVASAKAVYGLVNTVEKELKGSIEEINVSLVDKQDFRIFKSLEEFNEKKGTSFTMVNGVDNMVDIVNAMSNGEMLIITISYVSDSDVYFGLNASTGWTKMFTFIKANGLCDVECRTTLPSTFKRVLNVEGVIGAWQELATMDKLNHSTVEDVGVTTITPVNSNITGNIEYTVKNGICYVSMKDLMSTVSSTNLLISTTMPKPSINCTASSVNAGGVIATIYIDKNTTNLYGNFYTKNAPSNCSFSYLVAE